MKHFTLVTPSSRKRMKKEPSPSSDTSCGPTTTDVLLTNCQECELRIASVFGPQMASSEYSYVRGNTISLIHARENGKIESKRPKKGITNYMVVCNIDNMIVYQISSKRLPIH